MMKQYTYLLIDLLTIFFPVVLSFDKKVYFFSKWKFVFPALFFSGLIFLIWDYLFTIKNVWSFNQDYVSGVYFLNLPLEEILFFIVVPFACMFIYECLNSYLLKDLLGKYSNAIGVSIFTISLLFVIIFPGRLYTLVSMGFLALLILYFQFVKQELWLSRFYLAYLVSLVPFYVVNGFLTSIPVVLYNDVQNMGVRVFTIPFEDHFYSMSMLMLNIGIYEQFKIRKAARG